MPLTTYHALAVYYLLCTAYYSLLTMYREREAMKSCRLLLAVHLLCTYYVLTTHYLP